MSRILIIEDETDIANLEKDYLELSGFEVDIETDGTAGLAAALTKDYDLFLLDLMLPGMDGFDICRVDLAVEHDRETPAPQRRPWAGGG